MSCSSYSGGACLVAFCITPSRRLYLAFCKDHANVAIAPVGASFADSVNWLLILGLHTADRTHTRFFTGKVFISTPSSHGGKSNGERFFFEIPFLSFEGRVGNRNVALLPSLFHDGHAPLVCALTPRSELVHVHDTSL